MATSVDLLARQLADAYQGIRRRIEGLTEDEFWWEPAPDCWTVRRGKGRRWATDYQWPDPVPSPVTTIAWRLVHVGECKLMYHEYAFGAATLTWPDLDAPHTVSDAVDALENGHSLLAEDLRGLDEADLDRAVKTNWGDEWPAWRIFWTMIDHDLHHGAEIGVLRDLYRAGRVAPN